MSELTKEKIYKKELIAGGATGNNNLERIRSLASGGGKGKYTLEKEFFDLGGNTFSNVAYGIEGGNLVVVGGLTPSGNYSNLVKMISMDAKETYTPQISGLTALDNNQMSQASFVYGGVLYSFEGSSGEVNAVRLSDGQVFKGINAGGSNIKGACAVVFGEYVILLGGEYDSDEPVEQVYTYKMTYDSDLGISVPRISLSGSIVPAFGRCTAQKYGSYIYIFGGNRSDKIYRVPVTSNNSTISGDYLVELETKLPVGLSSLESIMVGKYIYLVGGEDGYVGSKPNLFRFNVEDETLEIISDVNHNELGFVGVQKPALVNFGNVIYILGGWRGNDAYRYIQKLTIND